jgi:tetratricopeptide (TPR) repeat protein
MTVARYRAYRPDKVVKPPVLNRKVSGLASRLFSRYYSLAHQLAADGRFAEAKDAYATILQLFPGTPQAAQAAQYAIRLFEKERGADRGAEALAGFLRWIREDVGVEQTDYAEYLAFQRFGRKGDPAIIADEAQGFLTRHPDSKWAPGIRLQLAVALDGQGKTDKAMQVLRPATETLDNTHHVRAAIMLAWLHILRGEGDAARPLLEAAAAQEVSTESASEAGRLLRQIKERPPVPIELKETAGPEPQDEIVAERLLRAADRILAAGDPDRAMDLYTIYLRVGDDVPGYWEAKNRIQQLKLRGRVDEE